MGCAFGVALLRFDTMIEGSAETRRIRHLDGWRGMAIIFVLIGHFGPFGPLLGTYGVELFFVLSGRLMAEILFVKNTPLPTFFKRRFSRIYPALLALVVALGVLTIASAARGGANGISPTSALTALTFTINYYGALGYEIRGPLDHLWSIAIEEHCYSLLAIIALVTARKRRTVVVICFALAGIAMLNGLRLYAARAGYIHQIYWRTDVRLAPVFLSAAMFLTLRNAKPWMPVVAALSSLPLFILLQPLPLKLIVPTILLAYAVNTLPFTYESVKAALASRALVGVGVISYSLYLWQQPFYKMTNGAPWAIIPAVLVAVGSYYLIEQPARGWINSLGQKPAIASAT